MGIDGNFSMGRTTYGLTCLAVNLSSFDDAADAAKRRNREAEAERTHRLLALLLGLVIGLAVLMLIANYG